MKKIANAIACIFIAVAVVFFIISLSFPAGSNGAVGPGYFPRIMCVLVILLSVLELVLSKGEKIPAELEKVTIFKKENYYACIYHLYKRSRIYCKFNCIPIWLELLFQSA